MGKIVDSIKEQLALSKMILKGKWDQGAQEADRLKEKQKKILKKRKDKK